MSPGGSLGDIQQEGPAHLAPAGSGSWAFPPSGRAPSVCRAKKGVCLGSVPVPWFHRSVPTAPCDLYPGLSRVVAPRTSCSSLSNFCRVRPDGQNDPGSESFPPGVSYRQQAAWPPGEAPGAHRGCHHPTGVSRNTFPRSNGGGVCISEKSSVRRPLRKTPKTRHRCHSLPCSVGGGGPEHARCRGTDTPRQWQQKDRQTGNRTRRQVLGCSRSPPAARSRSGPGLWWAVPGDLTLACRRSAVSSTVRGRDHEEGSGRDARTHKLSLLLFLKSKNIFFPAHSLPNTEEQGEVAPCSGAVAVTQPRPPCRHRE